MADPWEPTLFVDSDRQDLKGQVKLARRLAPRSPFTACCSWGARVCTPFASCLAPVLAVTTPGVPSHGPGGRTGSADIVADPRRTDPRRTDPRRTDPRRTDPRRTGASLAGLR